MHLLIYYIDTLRKWIRNRENAAIVLGKEKRMRKKLWVVLLATMILLPFSTGHAEGLSLGVKAGTLGIGPEIGYAFSKYLNARVGFNYFKFSYDGTKSDIDYDFDLNLQNASAILDWHPFGNVFRISGGIFYNGNTLDACGKPSSGNFKIGNHHYPAALIGNLNGDIDFNHFSPYFGIGVDTTFGKEKNFGLQVEIGALYQGSPNVSLTADGPLSGNPIFQQDLAKEEDNLQDDLDNYKFYPVLSVGISYRF